MGGGWRCTRYAVGVPACGWRSPHKVEAVYFRCACPWEKKSALNCTEVVASSGAMMLPGGE
jgi:hypothetical protein